MFVFTQSNHYFCLNFFSLSPSLITFFIKTFSTFNKTKLSNCYSNKFSRMQISNQAPKVDHLIFVSFSSSLIMQMDLYFIFSFLQKINIFHFYFIFNTILSQFDRLILIFFSSNFSGTARARHCLN